MKFLITGKYSQASLAFVDLLKENNEEYVALGRKDLDITDLMAVRGALANHRPDVVFNGAAFNDVDRAETDWEQAFLINGIGPKNLAIICEESAIPLITFSSDYVFDGKKTEPYTVADTTNPLNVYGKSKLLGENYVQSLCSRYILARVSSVFGAKGKIESCFPKKVLKWAETKEEIRVVDDQVSSPTYAPDLAEAVYRLLQKKDWGICHATNAGYCSRYEWAKEILHSAGLKRILFPVKSDVFENAAQRPMFSSLDSFPLLFLNLKIHRNYSSATEEFLQKISKENNPAENRRISGKARIHGPA